MSDLFGRLHLIIHLGHLGAVLMRLISKQSVFVPYRGRHNPGLFFDEKEYSCKQLANELSWPNKHYNSLILDYRILYLVGKNTRPSFLLSIHSYFGFFYPFPGLPFTIYPYPSYPSCHNHTGSSNPPHLSYLAFLRT